MHHGNVFRPDIGAECGPARSHGGDHQSRDTYGKGTHCRTTNIRSLGSSHADAPLESALGVKLFANDLGSPNHVQDALPLVTRGDDFLKGCPAAESHLLLIDVDLSTRRGKGSGIHGQDRNPSGLNPFFEEKGFVFLGIESCNEKNRLFHYFRSHPFTPLEAMARCSAERLGFIIIPAGFNALLEFLTGFTQQPPPPPLPGDTVSPPSGRGSPFFKGFWGDEELFFYASFKNPEAFSSSESFFFSSAVRGAK